MVPISWDIKLQNWELRVHCLGDSCWRNILTLPAFLILEQFNGQFVSDTINWTKRDNRIEGTEDLDGKRIIFTYNFVQTLVLPNRN